LTCDILLAVGKATLNGTVVFGKNSDRSPNEAQPLVSHPRLNHGESFVKCQNIEIPQVPITYEHIGSSPYWLWGYEHGLNEFGVVIGNTGVSGSKEPFEEPADKAGLIGMDLVRLGLERGKTAYEAMHIIINLIQRYGTGYCEEPNKAKYHNCFVLGDPKEAWILETSGRYWVAKRVTDGIYHQGNLYSIQGEWDERHPDLISHAIEMGWCNSDKDFNFDRAYWDYQKNPITGSMIRYRRGLQLLRKYYGRITPELMMELLRDHLEDTLLAPLWSPGENFYSSICCHERPWGGGQTAASMVVELKKGITDLLKTSCWASMTPPCTSIFMPLFPKDILFPKELSLGADRYSEESPWWCFKKLQRHTDRNYPLLGPIIRSIWRGREMKNIEEMSRVEKEASKLIKEGKTHEATKVLQDFVYSCAFEAINQAKKLDKLLYEIEEQTPKYKDLRESYLTSLNEDANIKI
jgi:dipeptidase